MKAFTGAVLACFLAAPVYATDPQFGAIRVEVASNVRHAFVSAQSQSANANLVSKNEWNAAHTVPTALIVSVPTGIVWPAMPAAVTEFCGASTAYRWRADLTNQTSIRLTAQVVTAGPATSALRLQYTLDTTGASGWGYLDSVSGPSVSIADAGVTTSATVSIATAAKAEVLLRLVGINGDGAGGQDCYSAIKSTGLASTLAIASGGTGQTSASAAVDALGGASSTGSGGLVRTTSPTLVTPVLGAATGTSIDLTGAATVEGGVNYCLDAVGTDSYACSLSPAITAYSTGTVYAFKAGAANTGAATLNLNAIGAQAIVKTAGGVTTVLADNDIRSGSVVQVAWDGTNFQLVSPVANATSSTITSGTTATSGCVAGGVLYSISNFVKCDGNLTFDNNILTVGNVTTAGRSTIKLQDTISGASATSNFLNITGTFPATLSATTSAVDVTVVGDNDAQIQNGINISLTGAGHASSPASHGLYALNTSEVPAGYAFALRGSTVGLTDGNTYAVSGEAGNTVRSVGVRGLSGTGSFSSFGVYGAGGSTAANTVGVLASYNALGDLGQYGSAGLLATNSTGAVDIIRGMDGTTNVFTVADGGAVTIAPNAAVVPLTINNGANAVSPLVVQDNGTPVLTVADGGTLTVAPGGTAMFGVQTSVNPRGPTIVNGHYLSWASSVGASGDLILGRKAAKTLEIGRYNQTASPTDQIITATYGLGADKAGDNLVLGGGEATGSGVAGGIKMTSSVVAASSSTVQTAGDRMHVIGKYTTLTETTATAFARVAIPTSTVAGGDIVVTVEANDATDFQSRTLTVPWSASNKAGTLTLGLGTPSEAIAASAGTLTCTLTFVDSGSGNADFKADCDSSLGAPVAVLRANAQIRKNFGPGAISAQ